MERARSGVPVGFLVAVAGLAMPEAGGSAQTAPEHHGVRGHTFEDTQRWVELFERPDRASWQVPDKVVEALHLQPGQVAADLGAGSGYFTFRLARAVGSEGRVYAVDIEPGMVEHLRSRSINEEGGERVRAVLALSDDARLPPGGIDLVLMVDTYHHIEERVPYLERLKKALRGGGRVAVVDFKEGDLPVGPPPQEKLARASIIAEFERAGYTLASEETFLPYQYFLVFAPVGERRN